MVQSWSILVEVALWLTLNFHPLFFAAAAAAAATVAADAVVAVAAVPLWRVAALQSVAL